MAVRSDGRTVTATQSAEPPADATAGKARLVDKRGWPLVWLILMSSSIGFTVAAYMRFIVDPSDIARTLIQWMVGTDSIGDICSLVYTWGVLPRIRRTGWWRRWSGARIRGWFCRALLWLNGGSLGLTLANIGWVWGWHYFGLFHKGSHSWAWMGPALVAAVLGAIGTVLATIKAVRWLRANWRTALMELLKAIAVLLGLIGAGWYFVHFAHDPAMIRIGTYGIFVGGAIALLVMTLRRRNPQRRS